jgi:hypothetical protein
MLSRLLYRLIWENAASRGLKQTMGRVGASLMNAFMFLLDLATRSGAARLLTVLLFTTVAKASEEDIAIPEILYNSLTAVPGGRVVLVSSLAALERTTGITQIRHLERNS